MTTALAIAVVLVGFIGLAVKAASPQSSSPTPAAGPAKVGEWPQICIVRFKPDGTIDTQRLIDADTTFEEAKALHGLLKPGVGGSYQGQAPGRFGKLWTRMMNANTGGGMVTVKIGEYVAGSAVYVSGQNSDADSSMLTMFKDSMLRIDIVKQLAPAGAEPFRELLTISKRPMAALVVWPWKPLESDAPLIVDFLIAVGQSMYFQPGSKRP